MFDVFYISLILFTMLVIGIVLYSGDRTSISHPLSFFVLLYYAYSTWYIYMELISGSAERSLLTKCIWVAVAGLASYCVGVKTSLTCVRVGQIKQRPKLATGFGLEKIVFLAMALGSIYALYIIMLSGYTTKREVADSGMYVVIILNYTTWAMAVMVLLQRLKGANISIFADTYVWIYGLIALLLYAVAGERDALYRLVFGLACIWSDRSLGCRKYTLFALFAVVVVATPFSQLFKSFIIAESLKSVELNIAFYLSGEFASAARNLYLIMYYEEYQSAVILLSDIIRGIVPFSSRLGLMSSASWYNQVFRHDVGIAGSSGWGFGLLAQGYMVSGFTGAMLLMFFVGITIGLLYAWRVRSDYWYVFYILGLATAIYCIRADLANFISQIFKVGGGVVYLTYLLSRVKLKRDK